MKIAIGSDHAGYRLKQILIEWLKAKDNQVFDFGTFSTESVDYPDFAYPTAEAVANKIADFGILICGTGIGVSIVANKVAGIRAANCCNTVMARFAREHNNANVLALGSRLIDNESAKEITKVFLEGIFEGGRHINRIEKIDNPAKR